MTDRAFSCAELRELDRRAIEEFGVPGETLMENAGRAVAEAAAALAENLKRPRRAVVLCGGGNNGGDGFVAARHLRLRGYETAAFLARSPNRLKGDALAHFSRLSPLAVPLYSVEECDIMEREFAEAGVVVDALLGTGFRGPVRGEIAAAIQVLNRCGAPVVAADLPSGLDGDSGEPSEGGPCVQATETVTMGALKRGFLNPGSRDWTGRVTVADIGYPALLLDAGSRP